MRWTCHLCERSGDASTDAEFAQHLASHFDSDSPVPEPAVDDDDPGF